MGGMWQAMARHSLPPEERSRLEAAVLLKRGAEGRAALEVRDVLNAAGAIYGTLEVIMHAHIHCGGPIGWTREWREKVVVGEIRRNVWREGFRISGL